MIYDITNHHFVKCNKCSSIIAYEEEDTWISTDNGFDIFMLNDFTCIRKIIRCPCCYKEIIISEDKKYGEEKENITKKRLINIEN